MPNKWCIQPIEKSIIIIYLDEHPANFIGGGSGTER